MENLDYWGQIARDISDQIGVTLLYRQQYYQRLYNRLKQKNYYKIITILYYI